MKNNYYCLVSGLQDITLDTQKLLFNQKSLKQELREMLSADDFKLVEKLYLPFDNENLINIILKTDKPFNVQGDFSKEHIEANLKEPVELSAYMQRFINAHNSGESVYPNLIAENELTTLFYDAMLAEENEFIRNWYEFNLNIKNILTGISCRKHKMNLENQIIGNTEVSDNIKKSHAGDFGLANILHYIEDIVNIARTEDIIEREKAIDKFKWEYLSEVTFFEYFTIDKILAFTLKTSMVERWLTIDAEYGKEMFDKLLKELKSGYEYKR